MTKKSNLVLRLSMVALGSVCLGTGISLAILSGFGADPLAMLWEGFSFTFGLNISNASLIIALLMALPALVWDRKQLGVGVILSPLIVALTTTIALQIQVLQLPFLVAIAMLFLGLSLMGIGIGIYTSANLGKSSYDTIVFMLHNQTSIPIAYVRMLSDITLGVCGWLLGARFSIGSICAILVIGSVMQATLDVMKNNSMQWE